MKRPIRFIHPVPSAALGAASALVLAALTGINLPAADSSTDTGNYLNLSAGGADVTGNPAAFQKRYDLNRHGFGGIDGFYYEKDINRNTTLTAKGHALFGNQDFLLDLNLTRDGFGYVDLGYKAYRTWFNGAGGFFSPSNLFLPAPVDEPYIDRTDLWLELGLTPESGPQFKFRYDYTTRKGLKDSTSWGDTSLTAGLGTRNVVPTFWVIDEHRNILDASLWQDSEKTSWNLNAHYEADQLNNALEIHRQPGASADRYLTQDDNAKPDIFTTHGSVENRLNDKLMLTAGAAYFSIDTTFTGSRIYGPDYDPVYDPIYAHRQSHDEGFVNLTGKAQMTQSMANLSVMYCPTPAWTIVPSLLAEKVSWDANSGFGETNVASASSAAATDLQDAQSNQNLRDLTGSIEARYTGIKNFVFNAKGEVLGSYGTLTQDLYEAVTGDDTDFRTTDYRRNEQKVSLTGNWYPSPTVNWTVQYYYKANQNGYVTPRDAVALGSGYPGLIAHEDFTTNDANVRLSWHALPQLRLVTRYDYQDSSIHTQQIGLAFIESSDMKTQIFRETATWNPLLRWIIQQNGSVVRDKLTTPASQLIGAAGGLVLDSDNNYVNGSVSTGYAIDDQSDVSATYSFYHATNFVDNSLKSTAFGQGGDENYVSVTWSRRFTPRFKLAITYAYADSRDDTSGGNNNYHANLFYTKMSYRF